MDAEFLGLRDNKIHLHKTNGVKIAVPISKMALDDIEYVERKTGVSLEDEKPLSEIKRRSTLRGKESESSKGRGAGAAIEPPKQSDYDWFDFFLQCGVNPQICEKYAQSFSRDQMGEESMGDISPQLLRTLGLKEGDILRVMKFLDTKYNRTRPEDGTPTVETNGTGGIFSGQGGVLKNNTSRKGRPAPPVTTNDTVDPKVFEQKTDQLSKSGIPADAVETPLGSAPVPKKAANGFDDDAWAPRQTKTPQAPAASTSPPPAAASAAPAAAPAQQPALTGALQQLSILDAPLVPSPAPQPAPQQPAAPAQPAAPTGATPSLFEQIANQPLAQQTQPTAQTRMEIGRAHV